MTRSALPIALTCAAFAAGFFILRPSAPPAEPLPVSAPSATLAYTHGQASPDGIGKFFHGREISQVMGHLGLDWLERGNREQEEAPTKAIAAIDLKPDAVIADIGAGSGYYSFRISPKVPQGKVIAIDIQPEMLDFLRQRANELQVTNVEPHLGAIDDLQLPAASLDAALMVDAYHEFSHPAEMLASLHRALKPGGRIFLLEFRGEDPLVPIKPLHKMTEAQARLEFESSGFRFISNLRPLPWQHFMVFERP
ncbi:MAG: class I SAM-dependent methyltransferase [Verrucomicrobia bacterium]|nr:MAG: class I SAM-dependent methyltransferase [Verrucomicrobiota bacterium]TAE85703.1 MAG: class I SAM-dependent methyltransferase [Verrucomicrobiota bacterium]TAF23097.1 MAG: class I SAM-dependent methyltransferase [Verrucomicrobiota bacterium]